MARPADPHAHEALLQAARTEFAQRGVDGARIEDISRRAGLAKGSFYLHFRSKEDAFRELLQRLLGMLEEHARRRCEAEVSCAERIGRLRPADYVRGNPRFEQALEVELAADVELLELCWSMRDLILALDRAGPACQRLVDSFRAKIRAQIVGNAVGKQGEGRLRPDVEPAAVADLLVGGFETLLRRFGHLRSKPDLEAWARSVMLVIYQGAFGPPGPRRKRRSS